MTSKYDIHEYLSEAGNAPFRIWLDSLKDKATRARIQARVFRFEFGNFGDHKGVGGGVMEARLNFGPGYRIYFALEGRNVVLLLLGGD